ncbi:MAG: hypothetical protein IIB04_03120, partial [Acidobacteria bacterium]|nr:hypothetical protein [Acidobacteriota bacterium]
MDAQTAFIIGIGLVTVLVVAAVASIAVGRGPDAGPITGSFDRRAAKADRRARKAEARKLSAPSAESDSIEVLVPEAVE